MITNDELDSIFSSNETSKSGIPLNGWPTPDNTDEEIAQWVLSRRISDSEDIISRIVSKDRTKHILNDLIFPKKHIYNLRYSLEEINQFFRY